MPIELGVVPDIHFATLHIAIDRHIFSKYGLEVQLREFPGGTGELAKALADGKVDIGIGLTEGFVTSISRGSDFRIAATFVDSPMKWVVLVLSSSPFMNVVDLKTKVFGITKFGGGAHINTVLISSQQGWKEDVDFKIKSLGHLDSLIAGLRSGVIDALVWEPFSIKSLIDITGDIKAIGDVIPPWPCFMVAERTSFLQDKKYSEPIKGLLSSFKEAAMIFHHDKAYSIEIISKNYKLSQEDSKRWFESVKYSVTGKISHKALQEVVTTLLKTGTINHRIDVANLTI